MGIYYPTISFLTMFVSIEYKSLSKISEEFRFNVACKSCHLKDSKIIPYKSIFLMIVCHVSTVISQQSLKDFLCTMFVSHVSIR